MPVPLGCEDPGQDIGDAEIYSELDLDDICTDHGITLPALPSKMLAIGKSAMHKVSSNLTPIILVANNISFYRLVVSQNVFSGPKLFERN